MRRNQAKIYCEKSLVGDNEMVKCNKKMTMIRKTSNGNSYKKYKLIDTMNKKMSFLISKAPEGKSQG
jgi:hypothetical protein